MPKQPPKKITSAKTPADSAKRLKVSSDSAFKAADKELKKPKPSVGSIIMSNATGRDLKRQADSMAKKKKF